MPDAWKHLNLEGHGLQSLNLRLARELRKPARAYELLALFPLGLHRAYLGDRRGAWAWRLGCLLTLALLLWARPWGLAALVVLALALTADALRIGDRCAAYNRALRRRAYFSPGAEPPKGYRGRYSDHDADEIADEMQRYLEEKNKESPSPHTAVVRAPGSRAPSFNEQEALLRKLARRSGGRHVKPE